MNAFDERFLYRFSAASSPTSLCLVGQWSSYNLNHEYNLAGELKKVTNNWGVEVSYGYDKAGRLSNVGGANYANVASYASALSYRAFGAIKGMNYGDGHTLSTAYDNRLRPTTWNVSGVLGYNYQYAGWHPQNPASTPNQIQKEFYNRFQKKFARCFWKVFGNDAMKIPRQTLRNASDVNIQQTTTQLGRK